MVRIRMNNMPSDDKMNKSSKHDTSAYWDTQRDKPSLEDDIKMADDLKMAAQRAACEKLKNDINNTNSYLKNASEDLVSGMKLLEMFAGKAVNSIKKMMEKVLEEINEIGERLNAIKQKASEIEKVNGGTFDYSDVQKYTRLDPLTNQIDTGIYQCDTFVLRNLILPLITSTDEELQKAKTTTSYFSKDVEGCENASDLQFNLYSTGLNNRKISDMIKAEIDIAEKMEKENISIITGLTNNLLRGDKKLLNYNKIINSANHEQQINMGNNTSTINNVFFDDITYDVKYNKRNGYIKAYSLGTPSTANNNEELPLIVYLHGIEGAWADEEKFKNYEFQKVVSNSKLKKPNAYILMPQISSSSGSPWCGETAVNELKDLIKEITTTHNINEDKIILCGFSAGGQGAIWMANEIEDFNKVIVCSGYGSTKKTSDVKIPIIGYIGGNDDPSSKYFMKKDFEEKLGKDSLISVEGAKHPQVLEQAYNIDKNNNGISDMLEFALLDVDISKIEETLQDKKFDVIPLLNQCESTYSMNGATISESGCGITCYAMVLSYLLDKDIKPEYLAEKYYGEYWNETGTNPECYTKTAKEEWGIIVQEETFQGAWREHKLEEALRNDQPVIAVTNNDSVFTTGRHYIVLEGITEDGKILVKDPFGYNYERSEIKGKFENGFERSDLGDSAVFYIFDNKETVQANKEECETETVRISDNENVRKD